jgi:CheY-like chemotaxis protein
MSDRGRILLADDEQVFLDTTADLLRSAHFACDTATTADEALARLRGADYDLLIADLLMPGNGDLALVRRVSERAGGLPVIILTGFPSTPTAIAAIELPVSAYLVKPVDFPELLVRVERAIERHRALEAVRRAEEQLALWRRELTERPESDGADGSSVDAFLTLTLRHVLGGLSDLEQMSRALANGPEAPHPCQLLNCPRGARLREAVRSTIAVLEQTKSAFRSRTLADLRQRLELLLETS